MAFSRTLQHFTSSQELATIWASGQSYIVNQLVLNNNYLYRCLIANTSSASFSTDLGAGKWVEVSASAAGAKNYISNGSFEQNTDTGWSLASSTLDATTKLPNQASGSWSSAAGTLAKSVISSGQLAGSYSLQLSSTAATTAGNMLVTDALTLDLEAQASVQTFSFFYKVTSNGTGTPNFSGTSSNAIGVAIYDVTNGAWIQPAGVFNLVQSSLVGKAAGTFQVPSNCTSVRLAVYFPNSTTASGGSPFTVVFDDFVLGPQVVQYGAPVTDWQSYTPTFTNVSQGTTGTINGSWRRIGDSIEVMARAQSGGAGISISGLVTISLPSFATIDTTKLSGQYQALGSAVFESVGSFTRTGSVAYNNTTSVYIASTTDLANTNSPAATWFNVAGSELSVSFTAPISGWSSSVQMSNDIDTRVVAARATPPDLTVTGGGGFFQVLFSAANKTFDTHGGFGTNIYTVQVSGYYKIFAFGLINTATTDSMTIGYTVNSTIYSSCTQLGGCVSNTVSFGRAGGYDEVYLNAGDIVRWCAGTAVFNTISSLRIGIEKASGPATIAASETVAARYTSAAGNPVTNGVFNYIDFATKDYDTHGMVSGTGSGNVLVTNTGWKATIPVSGKYLITASVLSTIGGGWVAGESWELYILKNAAGVTSGTTISQATHATYMPARVSVVAQCVAGDRIEFAIYQNSGATLNMLNSATYNEINIVRVGN